MRSRACVYLLVFVSAVACSDDEAPPMGDNRVVGGGMDASGDGDGDGDGDEPEQDAARDAQDEARDAAADATAPRQDSGADARAPDLDGAIGACAADVLLVVDGSGSMCETLGSTTRWQALRTALVGPGSGLVPRFAASVAFGVIVYDGTIDLLLATSSVGGSPSPACAGMYTEQKATGECPGVIEAEVALNNAAAIEAALPATELGGSTPTDRAMNRAVDWMLSQSATAPAHRKHIVLITDGRANDICVGGVGGDGSAQHLAVVAAVDRAAVEEVSTFVLNLGPGDVGLQQNLDEVARHGQPTNASAAAYAVTSEAELTGALDAVMSAIGCTE